MQLSLSLDGNSDVLDAAASKYCQCNGTFILFKPSLASEEYPLFINSLKVLCGLQVLVKNSECTRKDCILPVSEEEVAFSV